VPKGNALNLLEKGTIRFCRSENWEDIFIEMQKVGHNVHREDDHDPHGTHCGRSGDAITE